MLFLLSVFIALEYLGLVYLFKKLNKKGLSYYLPIINLREWADLIGQPKNYAIWLLVPIVNLFIHASMSIDTGKSYGLHGFFASIIAVVFTPFLLIYIGLMKHYNGPIVKQEKELRSSIRKSPEKINDTTFTSLPPTPKKSILREWSESLIFALFAAGFIRMFTFEPYLIPTPSMEGSMKVGDYLFVSKIHYGLRSPMTIAMFPMMHNTIPLIGKESYFSSPSLDYYRFPAIERLSRNKPFVFNWPIGDSVIISSKRSYHISQIKRNKEILERYEPELILKYEQGDIISRPIDKKDLYVKRCVASAGDTLQIIDSRLYINSQPQKFPPFTQFNYKVTIPPNIDINVNKLKEWGMQEKFDFWNNGIEKGLAMDSIQVKLLKSLSPLIEVSRQSNQPDSEHLFPHDPIHFPDWSIDNYGPIWTPEKGATTQINTANISLYKRIITHYENNSLSINNGLIYINGIVQSSYTFKQNYYWAMGDNRHNSEDSRMWGFVPEDHIVGKPLFTWFSTNDNSVLNGIRWNRMFKLIK